MTKNSKINQLEDEHPGAASLQRWADDDDWKGPFIPFFGRNR